MTGYSVAELMQPGFCGTIVLPEDRAAFEGAAQTVRAGKSTRLEAKLRAKDGSTKTVLGFFHPNFLTAPWSAARVCTSISPNNAGSR